MIGPKIRETRQSKGLTLNQLAKNTGFTAGYISQLERDIIDPSLSALRKIANSLNVPVYGFLEEPEKQSTVILANKRQKLELPDTNIVYEFLTPMGSDSSIKPKMVMIYYHLDAQSWISEENLTHKADECIFVTKGSIEVYLGDEKYLLNEGDSIYIKENVPHRIYNPGKEKAIGVSTISPAIY